MLPGLLMTACAIALLTPLPARAQWVPYQSTNTFPGSPQTWGRTPSPSGPTNGSLGVYADGNAPSGGYLSVTGGVTLTFQWAGARGQPVTPLYVLLSGSAGMGGAYPGPNPTALDGLGDPMVPDVVAGLPWPMSYASSGRHLVQMAAPAGAGPGALLSLTAVTLTASGTQGGGDVSLYGTVDSRSMTLHRYGARGETTGSDGTVHGDTVFSYLEYTNNGELNPQQTGNDLNTQIFIPDNSGDWNLNNSSPFSWSPSNSADYLDYGAVQMHYRNYELYEGDPDGQDTPEQRTVTETITDSDGTQASASYDLTVHDPNELGADTVTRGIENVRRAPNAPYVRATQNDESLTVYAEQGDSWSLGISADIPWVLPDLGLNASTSYTASYSAGVQATLQHVQAGYGTYLEEFDAYKYHTGPIVQWDTLGYVGTTTYHVKEPDSPAGGYQVHAPAIPLSSG